MNLGDVELAQPGEKCSSCQKPAAIAIAVSEPPPEAPDPRLRYCPDCAERLLQLVPHLLEQWRHNLN